MNIKKSFLTLVVSVSGLLFYSTAVAQVAGRMTSQVENLIPMDHIENMLLSTIPILALVFFIFAAYTMVFTPRISYRDSQQELEKCRAQIDAEITFRGEFDDWLVAESLRTEIDCAAFPEDNDRSGTLETLKKVQTENSARIVELHQHDLKRQGRIENDLPAVKKQWDALRSKMFSNDGDKHE